MNPRKEKKWWTIELYHKFPTNFKEKNMSTYKSVSERVYPKITSWNPDNHTALEAEGVVMGYHRYLMEYALTGKDLILAKTISEWLNTEI